MKKMETIKTIYKIGSGPSSSHTMGPEKAVEVFLDKVKDKDIDYYKAYLYGSLALTGYGHLTDKVIKKTFGKLQGEVIFDLKRQDLLHPNQMKIKGLKDGEVVETFELISVGGGNIEEVKEGKIISESNSNNPLVYEHTLLEDIIKYCNENEITLVEYVKAREEGIEDYLVEVYNVMSDAIERGINTEGEIPGELKIKRKAKKMYRNYTEEYGDKSVLLSAFAYAVNEENACGNTIVTAPTCGACGTLPAVLKYYEKIFLKSKEKIVDALMIAGLIGTITRHNASISGAEAGCQAEVGTATAMGAAAIMYLMNPTGDLKKIDAAAEIGLAHQLGLTCDPVLGYVQVPCIQRNPVAANKALLAAKLAKQILEDEPTSFDSIVEVMYETGKDLKADYRETSTGGLAKYYKKMYLKD